MSSPPHSGSTASPGHDQSAGRDPRPQPASRDRDETGRARNARARDDLGRPLKENRAEPTVEQPALPPRQALQRAQQLLDDGQPFAAHEVLEAAWKAAPVADRELWRGLAQLAVGITHSLRGNSTGAVSLLTRSAASLAPYDGKTPHDVDVTGLRSWAMSAAADLARAAHPPRLCLTQRSTATDG